MPWEAGAYSLLTVGKGGSNIITTGEEDIFSHLATHQKGEHVMKKLITVALFLFLSYPVLGEEPKVFTEDDLKPINQSVSEDIIQRREESYKEHKARIEADERAKQEALRQEQIAKEKELKLWQNERLIRAQERQADAVEQMNYRDVWRDWRHGN